MISEVPDAQNVTICGPAANYRGCPGIMGGAECSGGLNIAAYKALICIPVCAAAPHGSRRAQIISCSFVDWILHTLAAKHKAPSWLLLCCSAGFTTDHSSNSYLTYLPLLLLWRSPLSVSSTNTYFLRCSFVTTFSVSVVVLSVSRSLQPHNYTAVWCFDDMFCVQSISGGFKEPILSYIFVFPFSLVCYKAFLCM